MQLWTGLERMEARDLDLGVYKKGRWTQNGPKKSDRCNEVTAHAEANKYNSPMKRSPRLVTL